MVRSIVSSGTSWNTPGRFTPALLTSTSIAPNSVTQRSTKRLHSERCDTSAATATAASPISAAVSSTASPAMSTQTTRPPSSAIFSAVARPMPEPAPVTTQALPSSRPNSGWTGRRQRLVGIHRVGDLVVDVADRALEPLAGGDPPPDPDGGDHDKEHDRRVVGRLVVEVVAPPDRGVGDRQDEQHADERHPEHREDVDDLVLAAEVPRAGLERVARAEAQVHGDDVGHVQPDRRDRCDGRV